jgi:hypothetical protein
MFHAIHMQDNLNKSKYSSEKQKKKESILPYHGTRRGCASNAFNKPRPPPFKRVGLCDEGTYENFDE